MASSVARLARSTPQRKPGLSDRPRPRVPNRRDCIRCIPSGALVARAGGRLSNYGRKYRNILLPGRRLHPRPTESPRRNRLLNRRWGDNLRIARATTWDSKNWTCSHRTTARLVPCGRGPTSDHHPLRHPDRYGRPGRSPTTNRRIPGRIPLRRRTTGLVARGWPAAVARTAKRKSLRPVGRVKPLRPHPRAGAAHYFFIEKSATMRSCSRSRSQHTVFAVLLVIAVVPQDLRN
jgi:hypothetical protein